MKNRIFVSGNVAVIESYNNSVQRFFYTVIDIEELELVKEHALSIVIEVDGHTEYALYLCKTSRKNKRLHRLIMDTPKNLEVDHINHNGLDNRKINLRNCTAKENNRNRRKYGSVTYFYNEVRQKIFEGELLATQRWKKESELS